MRVITMYNTKGGTTKSTLAANLAGALVKRNQRVLLVDGDPQGSLTHAFELARQPTAGFHELLIAGQREDAPFPPECITPTKIPNLDVVVANLSNDDFKSMLAASQESSYSLRAAIDKLVAIQPEQYDYVLIDSSGARGAVSYTCAIAADVVVSPVIPDKVNFDAFFTSNELFEQLDHAPRWAPYRNIPVLVTVVRMNQTTDAKGFRDALHAQLAPEATAGTPFKRVTLLATEVPNAAIYPKAMSAKLPVVEMAAHEGAEKQGAILNALLDEISALTPRRPGAMA